MVYTARDFQSRVNGLFNRDVLVVDGIYGPKTLRGIRDAMALKRVKLKEDLFERYVRGIVWHWTASPYPVSKYDKAHYNFIHDFEGNTYKGAHTIASQVSYDWRHKIGASHTKNMNTGWIGQSCSAMGDAIGWPMNWGSYPLNWTMIDAMLSKSANLCREYEIPVSKWTTLSHAEVQETLGITQRGKWDFMVLPGMPAPINAVQVGDILRERMIEKFM